MFLGFDETNFARTNVSAKYYGDKWFVVKICEVSGQELSQFATRKGTFKILCKTRKMEIHATEYGNKEIHLIIHLRHDETLRLLDHFGHLNLAFYRFL